MGWRIVMPWRWGRPDVELVVIDGEELLGMANNSVESFREKVAAFQANRSTRPGRPAAFRQAPRTAPTRRPQSNDNGAE